MGAYLNLDTKKKEVSGGNLLLRRKGKSDNPVSSGSSRISFSERGKAEVGPRGCWEFLIHRWEKAFPPGGGRKGRTESGRGKHRREKKRGFRPPKSGGSNSLSRRKERREEIITKNEKKRAPSPAVSKESNVRKGKAVKRQEKGN